MMLPEESPPPEPPEPDEPIGVICSVLSFLFLSEPSEPEFFVSDVVGELVPPVGSVVVAVPADADDPPLPEE
jgi:hypothetical protein